MKILNKLSFGAGPRLPTERCGKTNCSNNARLNCVGIACPRWLPAIPAPQKIGFYPIWGQRLKTQLHGGFQANLAPWKNAQPVACRGGDGTGGCGSIGRRIHPSALPSVEPRQPQRAGTSAL